MPGPLFTGDPISGQGTITYEDGTTYPSFIQEFSGGDLRVDRGVIFSEKTGQIVTNVSTKADFTLEALEGGFYHLVKPDDFSNINTVTGASQLRSVSGSISVLRSDGTVQNFEVQGVAVNRIGYQWATYPTEGGGTGVIRTAGMYRNNAELQAAYNNPALSLATPEQAAAQSIAYRLMHDQRDILDDFARSEGLLKDDGSPDTYAAINQIMAVGDLSGLSAFIAQILQP